MLNCFFPLQQIIKTELIEFTVAFVTFCCTSLTRTWFDFQVFFTPVHSNAEKPLLFDTSATNYTDYETAASVSEPETAVPCVPLQQQSLEEREEREEEGKETGEEMSADEKKKLMEHGKTGYHTETTSESEACAVRSEGCHSNPEQSERRTRNTLSAQERGSFCGCHEPRSSHLRKPHAGRTDLLSHTHTHTQTCTSILVRTFIEIMHSPAPYPKPATTIRCLNLTLTLTLTGTLQPNQTKHF